MITIDGSKIEVNKGLTTSFNFKDTDGLYSNAFFDDFMLVQKKRASYIRCDLPNSIFRHIKNKNKNTKR